MSGSYMVSVDIKTYKIWLMISEFIHILNNKRIHEY